MWYFVPQTYIVSFRIYMYWRRQNTRYKSSVKTRVYVNIQNRLYVARNVELAVCVWKITSGIPDERPSLVEENLKVLPNFLHYLTRIWLQHLGALRIPSFFWTSFSALLSILIGGNRMRKPNIGRSIRMRYIKRLKKSSRANSYPGQS